MVDDYMSRLRKELGNVKTVTASEAKQQFGQVLDSALQDGAVVITKHDAPKAILISMKEFEAMTSPQRKLEALSASWDAMYTRMQEPGLHEAMERAFNATPKQMGAAAVRAARRVSKTKP